MMDFSSAGVVLFTTTTAPRLGLIWMVNSVLLRRTGVMFEMLTVTSTCSFGSTRLPEPIIQDVSQKQ